MCSRCSDVGKGDAAPKSSKLKGDLPTATTTTTATTIATTTAGAQPWKLTKGPCTVDAYGCILSPNYDKDAATRYDNYEECEFDVVEPKLMEVEDFNVESGYDYLTVNGNKYSGRRRPQGKEPSGEIKWFSDYSVSGWWFQTFLFSKEM